MKQKKTNLGSKAVQFIKVKAIAPITSYFKQGLDTHKLAQSVAAGVVIGTIPVIGVSSIMATFVGLKCRMFTALIMLITYLIYPLQMLLILPYMKLGGLIVGAKAGQINVTAIFSKLFKHPIASLPEFGYLILGGVIAWTVISIPVYFATYYSVTSLSKGNKLQLAWVKPLYINTIRPHFKSYGKYLNPKNYFTN